MSEPRHVVFYGSLREGLHLGGEPPFRSLVRPVGPCLLAGRLYEVAGGAYPGLDLDPGPDPALEPDPVGRRDVVHGELYELLDEAALALLDEWEEYDPGRPEASPYVRRAVGLLEPDVVAWVYVGRHHRRGPAVEGGDWRRHVERRGS